jgi:hypothetical protein
MDLPSRRRGAPIARTTAEGRHPFYSSPRPAPVGLCVSPRPYAIMEPKRGST